MQQVRAVCCILLGLVAVTTLVLLGNQSGSVSADFDPPGPPAVTDQLALTELRILTDQDDGGIIFGGFDNAEICVVVEFKHDTVHGIDVKNVECREDVETDSPPKTLVGTGGALVAGDWLSPQHQECVPTAPWDFQVRVVELDSGIGDAIELVAEALKLAGPLGVLPERVNLLDTDQLKKVGDKLEEIIGKEQNLGVGMKSWIPGEGDPDQVVSKSASGQDFDFKVEKRITPIPALNDKCPTATPTPTPTPTTPTPTPTPTPIPTPADPFGFSDGHAFSRSECVGRQGWVLLREATTRVSSIAPDVFHSSNPGPVVPTGDVSSTQVLALGLIGELGHAVAETEVVEAIANPSLVDAGTLSQAQALLAQGDQLRASAIAAISVSDLLAALDVYREVFTLLVELLHSTFQQITCPVGGVTELLVSGGADVPVEGSASGSSVPYAALAGGIAAGALALTAGGWYARRRWLRRM